MADTERLNRIHSLLGSLAYFRKAVDEYRKEYPGDEIDIHAVGAIETLEEIFKNQAKMVREKTR